MSDSRKILGDHHQKGKVFQPPFKHLMGNIGEIDYIERILPEIIWIQFLVKSLGVARAIDTSVKFLKTLAAVKDWGRMPEFSHLSLMGALDETDWKITMASLKTQGILDEIRTALVPFVRLYPHNNPLKNLFEGLDPQSDKDVALCRKHVRAIFDRRGEDATVVQAIVTYVEIESGKMKYSSDVPLPDLDSIFTDVRSEEAVRTCALVRMTVNEIFAFYEEEIGEDWASYFWNRGRELSPLTTAMKIPELKEAGADPFVGFMEEYEVHVRGFLSELWRKMPINIYRSDEFEVIGALLARQCNLAVTVSATPSVWDYYSGPLFLRALVDNYITTAWILQDPSTRAKTFISYGLGQEKLQIEHLKAGLEKVTDPERKNSLTKTIEMREEWVNSQHYTFLQEVDVGSWSGLSTRKMAEEVGCMDLYRYAYTPWGQAAHGTWNHIGQFDASRTPDPLLKHIRRPAYHPHQDFTVVENATKYLDKSYRLVAKHYKVEVSKEDPYDWFMLRANKLFTDLDAKKKPGGEGSNTGKE